MRIIFMGSGAFGVPTLRVLAASAHEVVGVVTQPDRPAGRGRAWTPPPTKVVALELGLPVLQPVKVSAPPSPARLEALAPDIIIVAAYGQILRQNVLDLPKRGSLNVHASLLPRHRGASPIAAAILAGDDVTGVSIMEVVLALDAGPLVAKVEEPISPHDTTGTLEARLAEKGAGLLIETLDDWIAGRRRGMPQDNSLTTYAPMVRRGDALIDWSLPAVDIWRRVRAYNPWPIAYTTHGGTEVRIFEAWPLEGDSGPSTLRRSSGQAGSGQAFRQAQDAAPGTVLAEEALPPEAGAPVRATFSVQTGQGRLAVVRVQRTGRKVLSGPEFLRGQRDLIGAVLGR